MKFVYHERISNVLAKYNAEMYYAVIGVQDDIETSLCVMEAYMPLFFKRALGIYRTMGMVQSIQNQSSSSLGIKRKKSKRHDRANLPLGARKSIAFTKNETPHKQEISELAKRILTKNLTLEYEFYDFIKQRLKLQVKYLKGNAFPWNWCFDKNDMLKQKYGDFRNKNLFG